MTIGDCIIFMLLFLLQTFIVYIKIYDYRHKRGIACELGDVICSFLIYFLFLIPLLPDKYLDSPHQTMIGVNIIIAIVIFAEFASNVMDNNY